ncbi:MAG: 2-C-methyl-D-erythritol 4-phosphate cytidylyltransferase [Pseudomonadota bacterium]|nr:2-C-methyl-D-erythritol 4-phosphate cytidylyltransferase [Pseudomonadota bacterium]
MSAGNICWAVVPAAGVGRRMSVSVPKQYLDLAGRPVIDYSLSTLLDHPRVEGLFVAVDPSDAHWTRTSFADHEKVTRVDGGAERCHSVLNALDVLAKNADEEVWVLVHDAARPCLRSSDLDRLLNAVEIHPVGGLLGVPVRDTMKQAGEGGEVRRTVPRKDLWHAFTPQMFRLGLLRRALQEALAGRCLVTDDASAVERMGLAPLLVEGHADNIKITRPEDLAVARFYLEQQGRLC